jgi:hypothetical protein
MELQPILDVEFNQLCVLISSLNDNNTLNSNREVLKKIREIKMTWELHQFRMNKYLDKIEDKAIKNIWDFMDARHIATIGTHGA